MHKNLFTYSLAIFCSLFLLLASTTQAMDEPAEAGTYTIKSIEADMQDKNLIMVLKGDSAPAYTMYELFSPARLVLDIAEAELAATIDMLAILPTNDFATLKITSLSEQTPRITRFEIVLADTHGYKVDRIENDLSIRLFPKESSTPDTATGSVTSSPGKGLMLRDIVVRNTGGQTEILLKADRQIKEYREDTATGREGLADSMFIDINDADGAELVREKIVGTRLDKIRIANRGTGVRIVFDANAKGLFSYTIKSVPQGLLVTIAEETSEATSDEATPRTEEKSIPEAMASDPTLDALIDSSEAALDTQSQDPSEDVTAAEAMEDSFGFAGYKTTRISVDFYKIDLHNVFRLFRQVSGVNLIVDEAVSGSLTLALNDVPWDFALDIILNLKNLKKEERHNTIVIYPAKKVFAWPERANDNLSFVADVEVIEQEALIIQQSTNQSAEIMHAKELLRRAKIEEKNGDLEDAAAFYEKALKLWPKNDKIALRLASLYLVDLRINAKCAYFAMEALKLDSKNYQAALYAAIASANMDNIPQAMEYFAQSISGEPPMKEALISYAAFSEEKGQPEAALKLLDKYSDTYSDTVDTMVSRARIYDTMGQTEKATGQYKALLYSGYQLVPGLKKYIRGRVTMTSGQLSQ